MAGFNWFDIVIIGCLLAGMAVGYAQGLIRQLIGLAALYVSLVLATQFFRFLSQTIAGILHVAPNTLFNMIGFFVIFFLALSITNFMALDAYKATRIRLAPWFDHITGMVLGVVSMWIIVSVSVSVLAFAVGTQGWLQAETTRAVVEDGLTNSRLAQLTQSMLPSIVTLLQPWLPSGLPALFQF
ncbi:MAG: CvpA family protein [Chloroflexi bacterium]|nr:CvpA family protein [Chloroflexota bacterium]